MEGMPELVEATLAIVAMLLDSTDDPDTRRREIERIAGILRRAGISESALRRAVTLLRAGHGAR